MKSPVTKKSSQRLVRQAGLRQTSSHGSWSTAQTALSRRETNSHRNGTSSVCHEQHWNPGQTPAKSASSLVSSVHLIYTPRTYTAPVSLCLTPMTNVRRTTKVVWQKATARHKFTLPDHHALCLCTPQPGWVDLSGLVIYWEWYLRTVTHLSTNLAHRRLTLLTRPTRWQHRTGGLAAIGNCMFWVEVWPPNLPFPLGVRDPHLTHCVLGPHKCTC